MFRFSLEGLGKMIPVSSSNCMWFMTCYSLWRYFSQMAQVWKAEKMWLPKYLHDRLVKKLELNKEPFFLI